MRHALALAALLLCGCPFEVVEDDGGTWNEYCHPTGYATSNSGVWIGPGGCAEATLYRVDANQPDTYALRVAWPMKGKHDSLYLENPATGDTEDEILYIGDPDFNLYVGDYSLGGLKMVAGANTVKWRTTDTGTDASGNTIVITTGQGSFPLTVRLSTSPGKQ